MARSNKYTSLNLNDVFEKKLNTSSNNHNNQPAPSNPSAQSRTVLSNSRIHGHMLVLTRPTPKPINSIPQKPENLDKGLSISSAPAPDQSISLRPQGRTGSGSGPTLPSPPLPSPVSSVKSDRFVPPHLRPGFAGKEEKPGPELGKGSFKGKAEVRGHRGSDPIEGRPKSGGGYEPTGRAPELADLTRRGSRGTRPSSSG